MAATYVDTIHHYLVMAYMERSRVFRQRDSKSYEITPTDGSKTT